MTPPQIRISGHFGEFLQGRLGRSGPVVLITVPCPVLSVVGWHLPGPGLSLHGGGQRLLSPERARILLRGLDVRLRGRVVLGASMPAGGGAGASTAALLAVAALAGSDAGPLDLARACIDAEGASDPLMFAAPERMVWASREGRVVDHLPPLPEMEILGGFCGPPFRTSARDTDFPDISDLLAAWRRVANAVDAAELAAESARRTLAWRCIWGDPTEALAQALGAIGFVIAHTGSARGLIFPAGTVPQGGRARLVQAGFRQVVQFRVGER